MNRSRITLHLAQMFVAVLLVRDSVCAQGYEGPLTIQGLDRSTFHSAASRAMGGVSIGTQNTIDVMFHNPAALSSLTGPQISLGGFRRSSSMQQVQQFAPVRYYSNFSLLMEGLTSRIPNPDTLLGGSGPRDTVQRPYDDIGPNWSRSSNRTVPLQGLLAVPFSLGTIRIAAGIGVVEYADMYSFYQNNNVLSPPVFSQRPLPTFRPTDNAPVAVDWSQYFRSREGSIRGYGAAVSAGLPEQGLSFGVSGMVLAGTTDDFEQLLGRGRLTFFSNAFRLDSVYHRVTTKGTSEYAGEEFTVSGIYRGRYLGFGISGKLPTKIRRTYTMQVETDTTGIPSRGTVSGSDHVQLPWRGTLALCLTPRENLTLGLEYEIRPFASAVYRSQNGTESSPWLSSSLFRIGVEYTPLSWLIIRGGIRGQSEVFEPEGNPIAGEPVTYSVYSIGVGIVHAGIRCNITYEYAMMKYQDVWGSAVVLNSDRCNTIVADVSYEIPRLW